MAYGNKPNSNNKPKGEAPIYKDFVRLGANAGISIAVWQTNFKIELRENKGSDEKPDWQTVGAVSGNKVSAAHIGSAFLHAHGIMSYPERKESSD